MILLFCDIRYYNHRLSYRAPYFTSKDPFGHKKIFMFYNKMLIDRRFEKLFIYHRFISYLPEFRTFFPFNKSGFKSQSLTNFEHQFEIVYATC